MIAGRTLCRRGHPLTPENVYIYPNGRSWRCKTCYALTTGRNHLIAKATDVIPHGMTFRQYARQFWTLMRRASGIGPSAKLRAAGRANIRLANRKRRAQTHCRRGHPIVGPQARIDVRRGRRYCLACDDVRHRGRERWMVTAQGVRISIEAHDAAFHREYRHLMREVIRAHPDKGGTPTKFIKAKKARDRFLDQERRWYAQFGMEPPLKRLQAA